MKQYFRLFVLVIVSVLIALPAQAHDEPLPPNAAADAASDVAITVAVVSICGFAAYFGFQALLSYYEKKKNVFFKEKAAKTSVLLATAGTMLLIWHVATPTTVPVNRQQTIAHADKPHHAGIIQSVGNNHIEMVAAKNGSVVLYLMGISETLPFPISEESLWAEARSGETVVPLLMHAVPQTHDPKGQASVFSGEDRFSCTEASLSSSRG